MATRSIPWKLRGVQTKGHVRPMFTVAWPHFVSVFDNLLSNEDGAKAIELVLKGLRFGIKIANTFDMHDACHAYINILTKHANLNKGKLLVMKNVECIRVLLKIAQEEGESICLCWEQLLCVMSSLRNMDACHHPGTCDDRFFKSIQHTAEAKQISKRIRYSAFSSKLNRKTGPQESIEQARASEKSNAINLVKYVDLKVIERAQYVSWI